MSTCEDDAHVFAVRIATPCDADNGVVRVLSVALVTRLKHFEVAICGLPTSVVREVEVVEQQDRVKEVVGVQVAVAIVVTAAVLIPISLQW